MAVCASNNAVEQALLGVVGSGIATATAAARQWRM
jgi:hypothetical protein